MCLQKQIKMEKRVRMKHGMHNSRGSYNSKGPKLYNDNGAFSFPDNKIESPLCTGWSKKVYDVI